MRTHPLSFYLKLNDSIFFFEVIVEIVEFFDIAFLHALHVAVHVHTFVGHFQNTSGNVGTMVGNTFQVVDNIGVNESELDGADTLCQTCNVLFLEVITQKVNDLLQRLTYPCRIQVRK